MTKQIRIGNISQRTRLLEELELPTTDDLEAVTAVEEAIDRAASERKGTAVLGPKGIGKSVAVRKAKQSFQETERQLQQQDATYERRRLLNLQAPKAEKYRDVVSTIWKALMGMKMRLKRGRFSKSHDELVDELVEKLLSSNVAVIVLDEAERLSDDGLEALRDVISVAESTAKERQPVDSSQPAGVGVTVVGTPDLGPRLSTSKEMGHRWVHVEDLQLLGATQAAALYRQSLSCFDEQAQEQGEVYWREYVDHRVLDGQRVPARFIEHHVRLYVRWCVSSNSGIETKNDVPYDRELFERSAEEIRTLGELQQNDE